jgi:hypothetical protein
MHLLQWQRYPTTLPDQEYADYGNISLGHLSFKRLIVVLAKTLFTLWLATIVWNAATATAPFWTIFDGADLLIHEAGHLVFAFLGQFIGILGGTLLQLTIPTAVIVYFLIKRSWYSAFFAVSWIGLNLLNIHWYIADARNQALPLIAGGGIQDWHYLLSQTGWLNWDQAIAQAVNRLGVGLGVFGLTGMAWESFRGLREMMGI